MQRFFQGCKCKTTKAISLLPSSKVAAGFFPLSAQSHQWSPSSPVDPGPGPQLAFNKDVGPLSNMVTPIMGPISTQVVMIHNLLFWTLGSWAPSKPSRPSSADASSPSSKASSSRFLTAMTRLKLLITSPPIIDIGMIWRDLIIWSGGRKEEIEYQRKGTKLRTVGPSSSPIASASHLNDVVAPGRS